MIRLLFALLLLATPAHALELKVATWNMEWLTLRPAGDPALPEDVQPKSLADMDLLRRYALVLNADIIGFQEVDGAEPAARVFPPDRYSIVITNDHVMQRTGFAIRRGLTIERNPDLVALDIHPGARYRLRSGADITLVWPGGRLRLLNVHLKTGCHDGKLGSDSSNCTTLRLQVAALQGWLAQRREDGVPFVLMGDLNRRFSPRDEMLRAFNAVTPLASATEGKASPCWGGNSFIDHILAGGAARAWMQTNTLRVLVYRERDPADQQHLSDHCPSQSSSTSQTKETHRPRETEANPRSPHRSAPAVPCGSDRCCSASVA